KLLPGCSGFLPALIPMIYAVCEPQMNSTLKLFQGPATRWNRTVTRFLTCSGRVTGKPEVDLEQSLLLGTESSGDSRTKHVFLVEVFPFLSTGKIMLGSSRNSACRSKEFP